VETTIFEPRLKLKPRLKFFKFGLWFTMIKFGNNVLNKIKLPFLMKRNIFIEFIGGLNMDIFRPCFLGLILQRLQLH